jgi:hypothetical protein
MRKKKKGKEGKKVQGDEEDVEAKLLSWPAAQPPSLIHPRNDEFWTWLDRRQREFDGELIRRILGNRRCSSLARNKFTRNACDVSPFITVLLTA